MKTIAVILLLLPVCISAQQKKSGKKNWRSITSAGFVAGQSGVAPVFDLSGGITYSRYFTGLGFGFDAYQFDAFPVFADWRMGHWQKTVVICVCHARLCDTGKT